MNRLTIIRPSILKSFCSNNQIWMRAFYNQNKKKDQIRETQKTENSKEQENWTHREKERTYALKKPEDQVLQNSTIRKIEQRGRRRGKKVERQWAKNTKKNIGGKRIDKVVMEVLR